MAYQTRGRDPLLDSNMAQAIDKRGKELLGLGLIVLGVLAAMMVGSYTPEDPNWMVSTDAPVQNWMGRTGASIAAPLFMIVGWGAWGIAIVSLFWGARFALHQGQDRAIGRLIFAPIAIALGSIYAATLTPNTDWLNTHSFGLGGLFGDTVMGAVLTVLPVGSSFTVKLMSFLMGIGILVLGTFVLGFTKIELTRLFRFLLVGLIMAYAGLMNVLGRGTTGAVALAQNLQARQNERRARKQIAQQEAATYAATQPEYAPEIYDDAAYQDQPAEGKTGLLARMPALIKRPDAMPEPELVEHHSTADVDEGPGEERIKTKIADVIKNRVRSTTAVHTQTTAPLTRGRGRGPDPLLLNTARAEPPLTAPRQAQAIPTAPMDEPVIEDDIAAYSALQEPISQAPELGQVPPPAPELAPIPTAEPRRVVQQPVRKPMQPSRQAQAEAQPALSFEDTHPGFELPPLALLESPENRTAPAPQR